MNFHNLVTLRNPLTRLKRPLGGLPTLAQTRLAISLLILIQVFTLTPGHTVYAEKPESGFPPSIPLMSAPSPGASPGDSSIRPRRPNSGDLNERLERAAEMLASRGIELKYHVRELAGGESVSRQGEVAVHVGTLIAPFTFESALSILGFYYALPTEFFVDYPPKESPSSEEGKVIDPLAAFLTGQAGKLYIRGYGDISWSRERLKGVVSEMKARGVTALQGIVVDSSLFLESERELQYPINETPEGAGISTVGFEYNSYGVRVSPPFRAKGEVKVEVLSSFESQVINQLQLAGDDPSSGGGGSSGAAAQDGALGWSIIQTPSSRDFLRKALSAVPGAESEVFEPRLKVLVVGRVGRARAPELKWFSSPSPIASFTRALKDECSEQGIAVEGSMNIAPVSLASTPLMKAHSPPLAVVLSQQPRIFHPILAEQLVYIIGQDSDGLFTQKAGLARLNTGLKKLSPLLKEEIRDGSGRSPRSRVPLGWITDAISTLAARVTSFTRFLTLLEPVSRALPAHPSGAARSEELLMRVYKAETEQAISVMGVADIIVDSAERCDGAAPNNNTQFINTQCPRRIRVAFAAHSESNEATSLAGEADKRVYSPLAVSGVGITQFLEALAGEQRTKPSVDEKAMSSSD